MNEQAQGLVNLPTRLSDKELDELARNTCVEMLLPEDRQHLDTLVTWGNRGRFWPERATIRIRFKNGSTKQKNLFWERVKKLDDQCGLSFKRVASGPSEVRVAFNRGSGHWSYVGTDNLSIPQQHQTMNIDLSTRDSSKEWDRVVIHELYHALGFQHEHQHPLDRTPWNKKNVYDLYSRSQGWSRSQIDRQVMGVGSSVGFVGTPSQMSDSIMKYATPKELVLDEKYVSGWNYSQSKEDIEILQQVYP